MGDAVSNHLNGEPLRIADRLIAGLTVTHHARKLKGLRDPATVLLPIELDCEIHSFSILPLCPRPANPQLLHPRL